MPVKIRQIGPCFAGEVEGVDMRLPLTPEEVADIHAGMDKYAVLIFHNQDITDEQQLAFARNFGEREDARGGTVTKKEDYRLSSGLNDVSNLGKDGKPLARDDLERTVNEAQVQRLTTAHGLRAYLGRNAHRPGSSALREAIAHEPRQTRSEAARSAGPPRSPTATSRATAACSASPGTLRMR